MGPRTRPADRHLDTGPTLVIQDEAARGDSSAVVLAADHGVRAVTAEGEWHATSGSASPFDDAALAQLELAAAGRRDALVAGFVPGIALGWSWPDMLRHAVALIESVTRAGEADLSAYEKLLPAVRVTSPSSPAQMRLTS